MMKRTEFPRPTKRMATYSHMLIAALALTSFVLLVKYRSLSSKLTEDHAVHLMYKQAMESDLEAEISRKKRMEDQFGLAQNSLKEFESRLKSSQAELSNTAKALQLSYQQIEVLKQENRSNNENLNNLKKENDELQQQIKDLQDSLTLADENIVKTKALADDSSNTLRIFQEKQALLLNDNHDMAEKLEVLKTLQGENEILNQKLKAALEEASLAKAKVTELESMKLKEKDDQMGSEQVKSRSTITEQDPQPKDAAGEEAGVQDQGNDTQQKSTETLDAKQNGSELPIATELQQDSSSDNGINNANIQYTDPSKATEGSAKNTNISEELKHYDMLEDDVKEQVKKEMQSTDNDEAPDGGEGDDQPEEQEQVEAPKNSENNQVASGHVEVEDDQEDEAEDNQVTVKSDQNIVIESTNGAVIDDGSYNPSYKKSFEESQDMGTSSGMFSMGKVQSWPESAGKV